MRSANYVQETTTSIAGTGGIGAVTLTQVTNVPRISTVFGAAAVDVRYVIEKPASKMFETGIGSVTSNVLTRTRPQVTWDGSTYDDSTPSPLAFGSTPTSGDVLIRLAPTAETAAPIIPAFQSTIAGDGNWRDYRISPIISWSNNGDSAQTLTADRENYAYYRHDTPGLLSGIQLDVTGAVAGSNIKLALYPIGSDGLPGNKIIDFNVIATATTGIKTDTTTGTWTPGPIWLTPGWYAIGYIASHGQTIRVSSGVSITAQTPLGRHGGYGYGPGCYVAGSYAAGLPTKPSLGSGTMYSARGDNPGAPWIGLKVVA